MISTTDSVLASKAYLLKKTDEWHPKVIFPYDKYIEQQKQQQATDRIKQWNLKMKILGANQ